MAKSAYRHRSSWYRLLLIPYAVVFYLLMGLFDLHSLDFLKRFMDFWGRDGYTLNFICAAMWVAGLIILVFAPGRYRFFTTLGLLLFLAPVWMVSDAKMANEPNALRLEWNPLTLAFEISTALWALMLVRGEGKTEWIKLIIGFALLLVYAIAYLSGEDSLVWFELFVTILPLSALTGFAVDFVLTGFSMQALLPALISMLASILIGVLQPELILWGLLALCLVSIILLLAKGSWRKGATGGIFTLGVILLNAVVIMLGYIWKMDLPKLF